MITITAAKRVYEKESSLGNKANNPKRLDRFGLCLVPKKKTEFLYRLSDPFCNGSIT